MNTQRNYNTYLKGMKKGNSEKLFFLDKINLRDFKTVIDFGCGGGDVLRAIADIDPELKLIGIDLDDYMRRITKEKTPSCEVYDTLYRGMLNEKTLIIFNSVLHEVEGYWSTLRDIISGTGATVVVRDMRYIESYDNDDELETIHDFELASLVRNAPHIQLAEFIEKWGLNSREDLIHYLLKFTYLDNWELELKENYFSFNWNDLMRLGKVIYENNYVLEFKRKQVKDYFNIHLRDTDTTHCQLILKLN